MADWLLVTRANCPLCDAMANAVRARLGSTALRETDVDADAGLKKRYDWDVPVLFVDGVEVCRHEFDERAFTQAVAALIR